MLYVGSIIYACLAHNRHFERERGGGGDRKERIGGQKRWGKNVGSVCYLYNIMSSYIFMFIIVVDDDFSIVVVSNPRMLES